MRSSRSKKGTSKILQLAGHPFHTGFPVLNALENGKKQKSLTPDHRVPAFLVTLSVPFLLKV
jgi:hypothetical protein